MQKTVYIPSTKLKSLEQTTKLTDITADPVEPMRSALYGQIDLDREYQNYSTSYQYGICASRKGILFTAITVWFFSQNFQKTSQGRMKYISNRRRKEDAESDCMARNRISKLSDIIYQATARISLVSP